MPVPTDVRVDALRRAGRAIRAAGFALEPVVAAFGGRLPQSVEPCDAAYLDVRVDDPALGALLRLFVLEQCLSVREARHALAALFPVLVEAGLLTIAVNDATAAVRMTPFGTVLVASDRTGVIDSDRVVGVEPSSMMLARLAAGASAARALDLGAGGGVQALLLATRCDSVDALDRDPRCLSYLGANLALNEIDNVRTLHGDWFAAVNERSYGAILANLPFSIAPAPTSRFEHSEEPSSDATTRAVMRGTLDRLAVGGTAYVLCSWLVKHPLRWLDPLESLLRDAPCQAIVLRHGLEPALDYAVARHRELRQVDARRFESSVLAWRRAFERAGVEWIAWGAVVLRRSHPASPNWIAGFEGVGSPGVRAGDAVEAVFAGMQTLEGVHDVRSLLGRAVRPAASLLVTQLPTPVAGSPMERRYALEIAGGAGIRVALDAPAMRALEAAAHAHTLLEAIPHELRTSHGAAIAAGIREMIASGMAQVG